MPQVAKPGPAACLQALREAAATAAEHTESEPLRKALGHVGEAVAKVASIDGIETVLKRSVANGQADVVKPALASVTTAVDGVRKLSGRAETRECRQGVESLLQHFNYLAPAIQSITSTAQRQF